MAGRRQEWRREGSVGGGGMEHEWREWRGEWSGGHGRQAGRQEWRREEVAGGGKCVQVYVRVTPWTPGFNRYGHAVRSYGQGRELYGHVGNRARQVVVWCVWAREGNTLLCMHARVLPGGCVVCCAMLPCAVLPPTPPQRHPGRGQSVACLRSTCGTAQHSRTQR